MNHISIIPNLAANPDAAITRFVQESPLAVVSQIARLPGATQSGKPIIIIKTLLPDGSVVFGYLTQELFVGAAAAFKGAQERDDYIAEHGTEPPVVACNVVLKALNMPTPEQCEVCKGGPCINIKPEGS